VVLDLERQGADVQASSQAVILLDTHAVIWAETGRLRLTPGRSLHDLAADDRWRLDEPPAARWFVLACELGWTRDPFDRLLAAHAQLRGWKLATADDLLIERLGAARVVAL
jgi:PIN domain nuclease of toxin-antitoxin system